MAAAIAGVYPNDNLLLRDGEWLVADEGTAVSVAEKLGVGRENGQTGLGVVLAVSGYFGRNPPTVWEWIKAKWGSE